jgi:hypothetical protein
MNLDFTTTAVCRPKLLRRTYKSFNRKMLDVDFKKSTLYLNVDPVPYNKDPMDVVNVAKEFFGEVIYNIPEKANFSNALRWCWSQTKGKMLFHLEDDWKMMKKFEISDILNYLSINRGPKAGRIHGTAGAEVIGVSLRVYGFKDFRICLTPSLFDAEWARNVCKKISPQHNPEQKIREVCKSQFCSYHYPRKNIYARLVQDTGRTWLEKTIYKKNGHPNRWFEWELKKKM